MIFGNLKKLKLNWNKILIIVGSLLSGVIIIFAAEIFDKESLNSAPETTQLTTKEEILIPIDFQSLWVTNMDIVAWIKIPNTKVDYPVLQSSVDKEENYYLNTTPEGVPAYPGSIYIQKINSEDFSDSTTAVYGHNMANKTMFGSLHYFNEREFFDTNNIINIYTPNSILEYKVFAVFKSDDDALMEEYGYFKKPENFQMFLDMIYSLEETELNHINQDVEVTIEDKLIILTTCIGNPNYRWRVVGVLVDEKINRED